MHRHRDTYTQAHTYKPTYAHTYTHTPMHTHGRMYTETDRQACDFFFFLPGGGGKISLSMQHSHQHSSWFLRRGSPPAVKPGYVNRSVLLACWSRSETSLASDEEQGPPSDTGGEASCRWRFAAPPPPRPHPPTPH